jgi:hypothetical protein
VRYVDRYPGLNLEIAGENGQWQWRLVENSLSPALSSEGQGGQAVRLCVEGADSVTVESSRLHVSTTVGELAMPLLRAEEWPAETARVEMDTAEPGLMPKPPNLTTEKRESRAGMH